MFVLRWLHGAIAGGVATAPMTVAMELMHRFLPAREQYPLPPSLITAELAKEVKIDRQLDQHQHVALTLLNHFGYGAAAGALYAPLADALGPTLPLPAALRGIAFGCIVWAVSYLGLLPALGILRPATDHPARRTLLMIAAHLVWGCVLGLVSEWLRRGARR